MKKIFYSNNKGVAAIEMAMVLPILLLIIAAVIEFGIFFLKSQTASRAVSTASIAIQQKPDDATIKLTMQKNGLGMMDLAALPNFICAKSYADVNVANSSSCNAGDWITTRPTGLAAGTTYYIAVRAFAVHTPLTPLRAISGAFPPDIDERNIISMGGALSSGWVSPPPGYQVNACYQPNPKYSPSEWCVHLGYGGASGSFTDGDGEGPLRGSKNSYWCGDFGNNAYAFYPSYKIFCVK